MSHLFDSDPRAAPTPTMAEIIAAYQEELYETPPFASIGGDDPRAVGLRKRAAENDVKRFYRAARRLGCEVVLRPCSYK